MKDYKIIKYKNIWFTISALLLIPGIIALFLGWLKPGLDFIGGTLIEIKTEKNYNAQEIKNILTKIDKDLYADAVVQPSDLILSIKAKSIDNNQQMKLFEALKKEIGNFEQQRVEIVGPTIGKELFRNSMTGFILVMLGIIAYLSFRFRYDYAICAIIALAHDVLFLVGTFAILGKLYGIEIDSLFVTAALTVAGFSVHDTIVVYDRIRENLKKSKRGTPIEEVANVSLNQTMARSINTSLTLVLTLVFLFLFGGESIKSFTLAMLIGVIAGTYSSICIASPLIVVWRNFEKSKKASA
ncbi:MAG: protein-export membrane protein SecF [Candidatus Sericytochromatia bacterium]|nr:MAG: protein-export membrane protein SecF [Candidatus Sericytochromatia bacterium]